MLSVKPWRFEAVLRLGLGVFLCMFAGSLLLAALHFGGANHKTASVFYALFGFSAGFLVTTVVLLRRPWRLDTAAQQLATVLLCLYAGLFLGAWAEKIAGPAAGASVEQMIVASLSFQGAGLMLVWRFVREHELDWPTAFGFGNQWRQALLLGFVLAGLFLPLGWTLQWVSARVMLHLPWLHLKPEEQQAVQTLQMASTVGPRVVLGFITIVLAPFAEEVLFRGILYPWLKQIGFPRLALWGTAVLFAAIHMNLVTFVPLALLAVALALLYERTNNLLAPITAHALFNGFNFTLLYVFQESLGKAQ